MSNLVPTPKELFFSKNDANDVRLGDLFSSQSLTQINKHDLCVLGYPDDEGIKLNGGRVGAAFGPNKIREFLYKMTPSAKNLKNRLLDLGNISTESELSKRHESAKQSASEVFRKGASLISLGGGHDYGYADAAAFCSFAIEQNKKPLVLNFDAHLDVRPDDRGFNSGTPFFRLLKEFANKIHFAEIGIQPQCNSLHHRQWAVEHGAEIFDLKTVLDKGGLKSLFDYNFFKNLDPTTPVFISFDIDGLTSSEAGGCSQSWATGLQTQDFLNFLHSLKLKTEICGLGIYEVSPPLDTDNRTAKTAALLAYNFIFRNEL